MKKDDFVACPIDKNLVIVDEDGKFLFATSAQYAVEGLREYETICDYLANYEVTILDESSVPMYIPNDMLR